MDPAIWREIIRKPTVAFWRVPEGPFTENTKYTKATTCEMVKERLYTKLARVEKTPLTSTLQE